MCGLGSTLGEGDECNKQLWLLTPAFIFPEFSSHWRGFAVLCVKGCVNSIHTGNIWEAYEKKNCKSCWLELFWPSVKETCKARRFIIYV